MIDALEILRQSSPGVWLFGIVAAGLFVFGLYSVLKATYREINIDNAPSGVKP